MVHWMDLVDRADEDVVTTHITKLQIDDEVYVPVFAMTIEVQNFAVPSWNRILAMHEMSRMKLRKLIHNIVGETVSGRFPSELCLAEYENLSRPSKNEKQLCLGSEKNTDLSTRDSSGSWTTDTSGKKLLFAQKSSTALSHSIFFTNDNG
jgi:hypothetical protein